MSIATEAEEQEIEMKMRDEDVPPMKSLWQLMRYIRKLAKMKHSYGTCVYAVSLASYATFRYMARKLGITGFQAGCADLDIIKRTRNIKVFSVTNYGDMLFPQYEARFQKVLPTETAEWLINEAKTK